MKLKFVFNRQYQLYAINSVRDILIERQLDEADFGEHKVVGSEYLSGTTE
ncbi:hypothetical protein J5A52_00640 [TM7 phylum sp. oral taxon 349]|jgi:hypothetical protein|nr:hypothetical protein J5A52_00640 [TM7 phylum sp. oral taxon 349]